MRRNERDAGDVVDFLASPTQERLLQEEVEELSLMTSRGNQQGEMKEWITPLAFGQDSRSSSVRKDTG